MSRAVIRLGDETSHGGKVISASARMTIDGVPVALWGDHCACPHDGHDNCVICEGEPEAMYDGIPIALEGHKTDCGATLIASQLNRCHVSPLVKMQPTTASRPGLRAAQELMVHEGNSKLEVVGVDDHFWRTFGIPYHRRDRSEFDDGIWSIFGDDIKQETIDRLWNAVQESSFPQPTYEFVQSMPDKVYGYYRDGTIYLLEPLILQGLESPEKRWLLFLAMAEEFGHHIDHVLRCQYSSLGGDAPGDEGTFFAADCVHFHDLLEKDFAFASFKFAKKGDGSSAKTVDYHISRPEVSRRTRRRYLLDIDDPGDDHGTVTLHNGQEVEVEFFAIRGAGAAHETITKNAALAVKLPYDNRLDEGSAWPDVPCADEDSVETCYYKAWREIEKEDTLAFRSHHGDLQYFHCMCPTGNPTNRQVLELIISKAEAWYERSLTLSTGADFKGNGLFHLGKLCHMVQDSFSRSHTWRDEKTNQVKTFQDYNKQDPKKHSTADSYESPGVNDAFNATKRLMTFFKARNRFKPEVERFLRDEVFPFQSGAIDQPAGGTRPEYTEG
jgi:uncharacterized Zn-binding protein involved in type VI secretion